MKSVPCPNKDKGICTIPDKTAVAKRGVWSVQSRAEIEAELPELDLSPAALRPLHADADHASLLETIDRVGSVAEFDRQLAGSSPCGSDGETAVVVNCSCGHLFIACVK